MTVKLARLALASGVAVAALTVLFAAPAHAYPPGPRGVDCTRLAGDMAYYADQAHEARMGHDYVLWDALQRQYEYVWLQYQARGC